MASIKANNVIDLKRALHRDWSSASVSTRASSSGALSRASSSATISSEWDQDLDCEPFLHFEKQRQEHEVACKLSEQNVSSRRPFWKSSSYLHRLAIVAASVTVLSLAWSRYIKRSSRLPAKWGTGRLALLMSGLLVFAAKRLGLRGPNDIDDSPGTIPQRQVLACWHPHGLYVLSGIFFSTGLRNRNASMYGWVIAGASAVFQVPIFREFALYMNARAADKPVIDAALEVGKSVLLCPGGIHEQLESDPCQERVFFPPNLGFVRQALKHGVPLLPIYNFGENQLYDVPSWSRTLSKFLKKQLSIGFPVGIGRWGLPFVPKKQELSIRVGNLVEVGAAVADPAEERVVEVFRLYCAELQRLFQANKSALPREVAERGLQIIWREHDSTDLNSVAPVATVLAELAPVASHSADVRQRRHSFAQALKAPSLAYSRL